MLASGSWQLTAPAVVLTPVSDCLTWWSVEVSSFSRSLGQRLRGDPG